MDAATSCQKGIPALEQLEEDLTFSRSEPNGAAMEQLTEISERSSDTDLAEAASGLVASTLEWYEDDQTGSVANRMRGHRSLFLASCPE